MVRVTDRCHPARVQLTRRLAVRPTDEMHRVTTLELLFDLVFFFALTQVTALMADDPTLRGLGRGLVLLALLWFGWSSYAWLGNQARADEGLLRVAMLAAMGALFVVALAIPESYEDKPGGLFAPFVLAACYATVRVAHLVVYLVAAGDDRVLRRQLLMQAVPTTLALLLLVADGAAGPPWESVLWVLALVVDYVGVFAGGTRGWRVYSAAHFAERHALIIMIAIGESVVAVGAGIAAEPVTAAVVLAALSWTERTRGSTRPLRRRRRTGTTLAGRSPGSTASSTPTSTPRTPLTSTALSTSRVLVRRCGIEPLLG